MVLHLCLTALMLSVTWDVDMISDDDTRIFGPKGDSPRLQVISLVGIGILLKLGM